MIDEAGNDVPPREVEAVTAAIIVKPGQQVTEAELIAFVSERLASCKKPRKVIFVDSVPKTTVGKLNGKALRDLLADAPESQSDRGS